ncbi:MAG: sodium:solute symporter family protein [Pseudonocardiaceae bacterium]
MTDAVAIAAFIVVLGGTSSFALLARFFRQRDELPSLEGWALAGRQFGAVITWFLLGGTIYTAYSFAAVPGLAYGVGALGFFALPYTIILCPLLFVLLPRFWSAARKHGHITVADYVRHRHRSPGLALAVALTGILSTMPYLALQLLGIRAVLTVSGLYPGGFAGDLILVAVFAVLAGATYRSGLRAPTVISLIKVGLIFGAALGAVAAALTQLGPPGAIFDTAASRLQSGAPNTGMLLDASLYSTFASLALGSALALPLYPHVLTATFAAGGEDALRRSTIGLPAWTAVLGLFGLLGIAALAAGVTVQPGRAEEAVPQLITQLMPSILSGTVFGALAVGALVPAAVMSIAVSCLFVRNIYVEYFFPTATPKHQLKIARFVSLIAKVGALAFVFGLRDQDAINLQLLGSVWILQTFPAVALGLFSTWLHRRALITGWAVGMVIGTILVISGGFSDVAITGADRWPIQLYAAVTALTINLMVAAALTPMLRKYDRGKGLDPAAADPKPPRPPASVT